MRQYKCLSTPIGELCFIVEGRRVLALHSKERVKPAGAQRGGAEAEAFEKELQEYLHGSRTSFTFKPALSGSGFKRRVLEEVLKVPYGATTTYKEIARRLSTTPRSVAAALSSNNILIVVPCHRVISASGLIGGYSLGVDAKLFLLNLEKAGSAWLSGPTGQHGSESEVQDG